MHGKDAETGQFTKGNRFWEVCSTAGRKPTFKTPEDLWKACVEYFEWVADNPLMEAKAFAYQGDIQQEELPKMRAMSVRALCVFLDISDRLWRAWGEENNPLYKPEFIPVVSKVEEIIYSQKFEGAAADLLNANIIARDLGLAERNEFTGKNGGAIETKDVTPVEKARRVAFLLARAMMESDNG